MVFLRRLYTLLNRGRCSDKESVEITPEMIEAGLCAFYAHDFGGDELLVELVYKAMASLAPSACALSASTSASAREAPSS